MLYICVSLSLGFLFSTKRSMVLYVDYIYRGGDHHVYMRASILVMPSNEGSQFGDCFLLE